MNKKSFTPEVNIKDVLSMELQRRQARNGAYSLRAFARHLQISPSFLCEIIKGKKSVREKTYIRLCENMKV